VKEQLGAKQNWSDSEDLCVMFKGTYTDRFYRAVRDALHAEVEGWRCVAGQGKEAERSVCLWKLVESMEPVSRNLDPTELPEVASDQGMSLLPRDAHFVPLHAVVGSTGEVNE
jgi:hypothetical protein